MLIICKEGKRKLKECKRVDISRINIHFAPSITKILLNFRGPLISNKATETREENPPAHLFF